MSNYVMQSLFSHAKVTCIKTSKGENKTDLLAQISFVLTKI